ncbi:hypothetical protein pb186bvf_018825 [Paramecium bursaria]
MGSGLQFIAFLSLGFYTTYTSPRLHESIKKNIHLPLREEVESDADFGESAYKWDLINSI